jgi:Pup amidohydrolase
VQWHYLDLALKYCEDGRAPEWGAEVCATWERILTALEADPMSLDGVVDWVTKYRLLTRYVERDGLDWDADKLKVIDVQYHDVRQDKGLYNRLVAGGRASGSSRRTRSVTRSATRPRTPAPTSAAAASRSSATTSPPRAGIRSSSTSAARRSSACP